MDSCAAHSPRLRWLRRAAVRLALAAGVLAAGCLGRPRHEVLSVFFDGVPDPNAPAPVASAPAKGKPARTRRGSMPVEVVKWVVHEPFGENDCARCHQGEASQELKKPVPRLCYGCHENWTKEHDIVHEPVKKGECASCHAPHKSRHEHLLVNTVRNLCDSCHKPPPALASVHEPFAKGDCTACHDPHGADNEPLLSETGNTLCASCHKPEHFARAPGHAGQEAKDCTSCHDAHQAARPHLMKPAT